MRIVAFRGGGLRGLIPALGLERLEADHAGWYKKADVLAGTSTGAFLALGLAAGLAPSELVKLYTQKAARIFADSTWDNIKDLNLGGVSLRGAQYSSDGLRSVLTETFGDMRLGDLEQDVLIPAFDLDNKGDPRHWKPKFYSSHRDPDELVVDVGMRTSAAPTYFPTYQGFVDGGMVCNDPSLAAMAYAVRERMDDGIAALFVGSFKVLTFGTGQVPKYIEGEDNKDWGALKWARHLLDVTMDGGVMVPLYQVTTLLGERHCFLNPTLPEEIPLDGNAYKGEAELRDSLKKLEEIGRAMDLSKVQWWLVSHWW